jgi:hypothetical protein
VTHPIQPDRIAPAIPDRDRPSAVRNRPTAQATPQETKELVAPDTDTAHVDQGAALLRNSAAATRTAGAVETAEQASALAARIAEALRGDPARAMQAYSAVQGEAVHALLATA